MSRHDPSRLRAPVLGVPIDVVTAQEALARVASWAHDRQSRTVCFCNAHSAVTARRDPVHLQVLAGSDLVAPDGSPVAWMVRRQGHREQARVSGPDFMLAYLEHAATCAEPLFLFGSTESTLAALKGQLLARWPSLKVVGTYSPPFRPLTVEEDSAVVAMIRQSGAATVWVSLGCPKQERWMADHRDMIPAVMLGVGAAFDFHAGVIKRAPPWMQRWHLEWLHRLASEPRRLWRRYFSTNTRFILYAVSDALGIRSRG